MSNQILRVLRHTIWSTPQAIFDALHREFGFQIDLCADDSEMAKCETWLPPDLDSDWRGSGAAWLNPPYGREIDRWVAKALQTPRVIVACLPGRTNAPWWHDYVMKAKEIRFVRRKVSFTNSEGCKGVPPWGAVIVVFDGQTHSMPQCKSWDWRTR